MTALRNMLIAIIVTAVPLAALWLYAGHRAELRNQAIQEQHPVKGEILRVNGQDTHVVVRGTGPDLVLIHGAGGSHKDFTYDFVDRLASRYRVFAIDRPGFGWSERIAEQLSGPLNTASESPVEQARHLAEAVRSLGAERPLVLGHSYGAAVAMGWALEEPAAGIIVVSGATMPWPGRIDWTYRVLGTLAGGALLPPVVSAFVSRDYVHSALGGVFAPQPVPPNYLTEAGVMMATRVETLRANARQVSSLRPHVIEMSSRYHEVEIPVEILHGTADQTVYQEVHALPLSNLLPNARLTILDGVGHMPHHAVPDDVIAAVDRAATRAGLR